MILLRGPRRAAWVLLLLVVAVVVAVGVARTGIWSVRTRSLMIPNEGVTLAASLALPRWIEPPYPAAVVVHGSGPTRRRDLRRYVRRLVPHGIAVLTYDKRGVGESGGTYRTIDVKDSERELGLLAADAAAALRALSGLAEIDPARIGLIGGSQAGWVMPVAAARHDDAAFVISISGPAVTYGQEIRFSRLTGDDPGPWRERPLSDDEIERRLRAFDGPHGLDPVPVLARLDTPSLWILGGRDRSVPTAWSVANLERLRAEHGRDITIRVHPTGDHALRDADTGRRIDFWPEIVAWLTERGILAGPEPPPRADGAAGLSDRPAGTRSSSPRGSS